MNDRAETPHYLRHYRELVDRVGAAFEATGWRSRAFQRDRFRVMAEMEDFEGLSVLDAGAGRADLAAYLIEHGVRFERFIALDAMPEMVEAIRRRGIRGVEPRRADFADDPEAFSACGSVDTVVFSGSLNTLRQSHALEVLERAWAAAERSVVFNFLSDRAPAELLARPTEPAHRFSTLELVDWALAKTPLVQLRHEYLGGHDATIAMTRLTD